MRNGKELNLYWRPIYFNSMLTLIELKACLGDIYSGTKLVFFLDVFSSFFESVYSTTTRSLSRYSEMSLRTWFRFLKLNYNWILIRVRLFKHYILDSSKVYLLVADETVEGKAGICSHGISKFYSSTAGKPIKGVCFFGMSLVDTASRNSYMIGVEQVVYSEADKVRIATSKAKKGEKKNKKSDPIILQRGRKKGTKNKEIIENPTASYRVFKSLFNSVTDLLTIICPSIKISYLVLDSAYGTLDYQIIAAQKNIPIISKLKSVTALYLPYIATKNQPKKQGRPTVYGEKLSINTLPNQYLKKVENDGEYKTETYQLKAYAKNTFGQKLLNIVIQKKQRISDGKISTNIWMSTDLDLDWIILLDYYGLRFQIEFDFRDAKQHFGLSDFKNYKEENLTNFVNLSFTMCLLAKIQLAHYRKILNAPNLSIIDLKLIYKARFTAKKIRAAFRLKLVRKDANIIFNEQFCNQFIPQDLINAA